MASSMARASDNRNGDSSFLTGFVVGGVLFGTLGFLFAPQISKALLGDDQRLKLPRFMEDEPAKDPEATKQDLVEKIAQLNASIDEVSSRLGPRAVASDNKRRLPVRSIQKCGSLASRGAAPRRVQTHQALIGRQQPAAPRSAESNVPDDLLEHLAATPGVRVVVPGQGNELLKEEDDDDDDAWDEVMAELSDPWMAEPPPAHDELAPFNGAVPAPLSSLPPGSLEAPGGAVAAAEVVVLKEVEEVLALQQAQGTQLVLLDVRSEQEWETGHVPGSNHLPIKQLTGQAAAELAAQPVLASLSVWDVHPLPSPSALVG
ncbi:hypothetical protein QJQ45_019784 [Haematococcus lacustris]|nr:hypothetical protein QJQ45_019784 [Haematococcus lacustris]